MNQSENSFEGQTYDIWVGGLHPQVSEVDLSLAFSRCGEIKTVRIMKREGISRGFGFVNLATEEAQEKALSECNGMRIRGQEVTIKKAINNQTQDKKRDREPEEGPRSFSVFVGSLPENVQDDDLRSAFQPFGSIKSTRVVMNELSSNGFGFVNFEDEAGQTAALNATGVLVKGLPVDILQSRSKDRSREPVFERGRGRGRGSFGRGRGSFGRGAFVDRGLPLGFGGSNRFEQLAGPSFENDPYEVTNAFAPQPRSFVPRQYQEVQRGIPAEDHSQPQIQHASRNPIPPESRNTLYLGNLPRELEKEEMLAQLEDIGGPITELLLKRGFAFVKYSTFEDAEQALAKLRGCNLEGRCINVQFSKTDQEKGGANSQHTREERARRTLYVQNIRKSITDEDMRMKFSIYGETRKVVIVKNPQTGDSKGFAFVEFEHESHAIEAARVLDGTNFQGQQISVKISRAQKGPEEISPPEVPRHSFQVPRAIAAPIERLRGPEQAVRISRGSVIQPRSVRYPSPGQVVRQERYDARAPPEQEHIISTTTADQQVAFDESTGQYVVIAYDDPVRGAPQTYSTRPVLKTEYVAAPPAREYVTGGRYEQEYAIQLPRDRSNIADNPSPNYPPRYSSVNSVSYASDYQPASSRRSAQSSNYVRNDGARSIQTTQRSTHGGSYRYQPY